MNGDFSRLTFDRRNHYSAVLQQQGRVGTDADWNNLVEIVLRRLAEKLVVGEIHDEQVTVADRMEYLLERTKTEKSFIFTDLFPNGITLRLLVATFLAVLELTRLKRLRLQQDEAFADIRCNAVEDEIPLESPANPNTVTA